jgi:mannose-6-phosphate isomerase-like protein (cupin superfamily)
VKNYGMIPYAPKTIKETAMSNPPIFPVPFVIVKMDAVIHDAEHLGQENKLKKPGNNGRKIIATNIIPEYGEVTIDDPIWKVPKALPTGDGGLEVSTFTEYSGQERHMHMKCTEIYSVIKGTMDILINDEGPYSLQKGEEVVILPGTIHQVIQRNPGLDTPSEMFDLVVRVHGFNCFGSADKYVQLGPQDKWRRWDTLSKEDRDRAYKI